MVSRPNSTDPLDRRAAALYGLLARAPRDRLVTPRGQPFAFRSHRGRVRPQNEDAVIVLTGRRPDSTAPFLAAIVCDGIGGLEHGAQAADIAAAWAGAALAADDSIPIGDRMLRAIEYAHRAIFQTYHGRAGAVLAAVLTEGGKTVIGWVGDARVYGLVRGEDPQALTRDDTIAAEVERIEGSAPEAMDSLVQALGLKPDVAGHVAPVDPQYVELLLMSDGVHRMEPVALSWLDRHAGSAADLAERLVTAALWEGGNDNASALVVDLSKEVFFDEPGPLLYAWVESQPRIWERMASPPQMTTMAPSAARQPLAPVVPPEPIRPATRPHKRKETARVSRASAKKGLEQAPLRFEIGDEPGDKP